MDETLAYDSWVTVGADNSSNNSLWNIGIDFASSSTAGGATRSGGRSLVRRSDGRARRAADARNLVLLMQITTDGDGHWHAEHARLDPRRGDLARLRRDLHNGRTPKCSDAPTP